MSSASRRRFRIARRALGARALAAFGPALVRALSASWRVERLGVEHRDAALAGGPCVLALWHGRLLLPLLEHASREHAILVSPSDDGSLVARLLLRHGQLVVRGSSNKAPARALRRLADELASGRHVVLTPDGPRGPRHAANRGAAWLAAHRGVAILPLGLACDRAWRLASWDRFTIPKPRARVAIAYGEPLRVRAGASEADLAAATATLRERLLALERRGFAHLDAASDLGADA